MVRPPHRRLPQAIDAPRRGHSRPNVVASAAAAAASAAVADVASDDVIVVWFVDRWQPTLAQVDLRDVAIILIGIFSADDQLQPEGIAGRPEVGGGAGGGGARVSVLIAFYLNDDEAIDEQQTDESVLTREEHVRVTDDAVLEDQEKAKHEERSVLHQDGYDDPANLGRTPVLRRL